MARFKIHQTIPLRPTCRFCRFFVGYKNISYIYIDACVCVCIYIIYSYARRMNVERDGSYNQKIHKAYTVRCASIKYMYIYMYSVYIYISLYIWTANVCMYLGIDVIEL